jgi:hypothetical protein
VQKNVFTIFLDQICYLLDGKDGIKLDSITKPLRKESVDSQGLFLLAPGIAPATPQNRSIGKKSCKRRLNILRRRQPESQDPLEIDGNGQEKYPKRPL